jgi:hypothetical protein
VRSSAISTSTFRVSSMIAMQRRRCETCASRSSCISDEISLLMWFYNSLGFRCNLEARFPTSSEQIDIEKPSRRCERPDEVAELEPSPTIWRWLKWRRRRFWE